MSPPILFLIFNRPDTTERVFQAIKEARPSRLYVAADGPRPNRPQEADLCSSARKIIEAVDWPCQVRTLYRDENLGCRRAVSEAITWFFEEEPEGIILEDDCLPDPSFFAYCSRMLDEYRDNESVMSISGSAFYRPIVRTKTHCFTYYADMWGWASWRRAWETYDGALADWSAPKVEAQFPRAIQTAKFWNDVFRITKEEGVDSWGYRWVWSVMGRGGLVVTPFYNMISNIGVRPDGTHTVAEDWHILARRVEPFPNEKKDAVALRRDPLAERYLGLCRLGVPRQSVTDKIFARAQLLLADITTYSGRMMIRPSRRTCRKGSGFEH